MSFTIDLNDIEMYGDGLVRPEGVMAMPDGTVWCAHGGGHCTRINPDGASEHIGDLGGQPNGICIDHYGNVVVANIGNGQVQRLFSDGSHEVVTGAMEGRPMPTPNFPYIDSKGRLWVTNSTNLRRHVDASRRPIPDGSLCIIESGATRIVAEGLLFANGVTLDAEEKYVYVAETMGRCIVRYEVLADGSLGRPEQYGPEFGELGHPDGCAFDSAGNLWVTLVVMNAIGIITPEREFHIVVHDEKAEKLQRPTNICFGGEDLRTAYIGNLKGPSLPCFKVPHPGMPLIHQM